MLYRIFEPAGGVSRFIQTRRLNQAFEAVVASSKTHISLAQVAFEHGFRSDAHFSRAFRKRFGIPPGALKIVERNQLALPFSATTLADSGKPPVFEWLSR